MKKSIVKFRVSTYEKKMLKKNAAHCGLPLSEYLRRVGLDQEIKPRLTEREVQFYKTLIQYANNFKSIGNMYSKKDPNLKKEVWKVADLIKRELSNFRK